MSARTEAQVTARSRTYARAQIGMAAPRVIVETHLHGGLPGTTLVGVPAAAVREARDRVRSALINCGFDYPDGRVVVNLAPVDLAKEGGRFDLAIAVSILRASGQLEEPPGENEFEFLGELSLSGELRRIRGCLCAALSLEKDLEKDLEKGLDQAPEKDSRSQCHLIVPFENAREAGLVPDRLLPVAHLLDVVNILAGRQGASAAVTWTRRATPPTLPGVDQVLGQVAAKRSLAVAASGGHHLLMVGPPGTGKSLLASRLPDLLPRLAAQQALEVAAVYSAAGLDQDDPSRPPIRSPHHSVSATAMVGGGAHPRPGEISLAHHGVLFLDELPHFKPSVLDALREPLETRTISIARAAASSRFPAHFQLLAAMNPCPAGFVCSERGCRCRPDQKRRYQARISGPLLDRIDLHVPVDPVPKSLLLGEEPTPPAASPEQAAVAAARQRQHDRQGKLNALLSPGELQDTVPLDVAARRLLSRATDRYELSARGFHRVLRVARTVADLDGSTGVSTAHLAEALGYRAMDWSGP